MQKNWITFCLLTSDLDCAILLDKEEEGCTMSEQKAVVGVSVLSYGPLGAWLTWLVSWWAKRDGFRGLQMLPVVGFVPGFLALPVLAYEDVWCPGNIPLMWLRAKILGRAEPTVFDLVLFPWFYLWQRLAVVVLGASGAKYVSHGHDGSRFAAPSSALLEVHPGLWRTPAQIMATGRALVLDTEHLRRPPKPDHREQDDRPTEADPQVSLLGGWRLAALEMAPHVVGVHVSPRRGTDEAIRFANGEPTELAEMIRYIQGSCKPGYPLWWIVETAPFSSVKFWKNRAMLRRFRERLESILAE